LPARPSVPGGSVGGGCATDLHHGRLDDVPANPAEHEGFFRPIRVGPELLTYLDQAKRNRFLKEWRRALQTR
jgi:iron(III) transport system substrate-binding protein